MVVENQQVEKLIAMCGIVAAIVMFNEEHFDEEQRRRRIWTREWIMCRSRDLRGIINMAHEELRFEDPACFEKFFRMRMDLFDRLVVMVTPYIQRQITPMRECISPRERVSVTLRFLATGESYRSLEYSTRIPAFTISRIIPETSRVIYEVLRKDYLKIPNTNADWKRIAMNYLHRWNVPNCIGSIDGRHIQFKAARKDGSLYFNYKGTNSIALLAIVYANYEFTYVNVGVNGRISDGGGFRDCDFSQFLNDIHNPLNIPGDKPLPDMNTSCPYVILADNAFPLQKHIMKPYPTRNLSHDERIFNYRLSRGRRIVENSFGILANRFRVLSTAMDLPVDVVQTITLACCTLHNYICHEDGADLGNAADVEDVGNQLVMPGEWRNNPHQLQPLARNNDERPNRNAIVVRNKFKEYFKTVSAVPWQEGMI